MMRTELLTGVLAELMENTLVHGYPSESRGRIDVRFEVVDSAEGLRIQRIHFRDWGKGLSSRQRIHLFDPYFTGDNRHLDKGMGLFAVYQTVTRELSGSIVVQEPEDGGLAFVIEYPIPVED